MEFSSRYVAHVPDARGLVDYSAQENRIWNILFERQLKLLPGRACDEFLSGLQTLGLNSWTIPQLPEVSERLKAKTGWQVAPVAALISAREFFELLAEKYFPAATFIRSEDELDYVQEPDIFHELFGHCPMLTDRVYAEFVHDYARKVLTFPEQDWALLQRMFWFTVEFGLIKTLKGLEHMAGGFYLLLVKRYIVWKVIFLFEFYLIQWWLFECLIGLTGYSLFISLLTVIKTYMILCFLIWVNSWIGLGN